MRVFIPEMVNAKTMYAVLGQVFDEAGVLRSDRYLFDFEETRDVDEAGWVMLDTLFLRLASRGCATQIRQGENLPAAVQRVLNVQIHSVRANILDEALCRGIKVHRVPVADAEVWLHKVYNNWLARELYASSLIVAPQTQPFLELLDNVRTHSGVALASVATSYHAHREVLRLVLSDAGRGIPEAIRPTWNGDISDEVGIVKAIEGGSLAHGELPRREGGLGQLVQEVVDQRAGTIVITSGFGRLRCFPNAGGKVHVFEPVNAFYPGTMIEVYFSTNPIQSVSILNEPSTRTRFVLK